MPETSFKPKLIIETYRGDPILGLSISSQGCISGTVLGRVCTYVFTQEEIPFNTILSDKDFVMNEKKNYTINTNNASKEKLQDAQDPDKHSEAHMQTPKSHSLNSDLDELNQTNFPHKASKTNRIHNKTTSLAQPTNKNTEISNAWKVLAAYSSDPIKFVHLTDSHAYAISDEGEYYCWDLKNFNHSSFSVEDWKFRPEFNEVMHFNGTMLIITTRRSVVVNIENHMQQNSNFSLFDRDLCLMDFNSEYVLCFVKPPTSDMFVYVVKVLTSLSGQFEEDLDITLDKSFKFEIPHKTYISCASFWNPDRIVLAYNAKELRVFNFKNQTMQIILKGHKSDIIAIEGSCPDTLVSLSKDQKLKLWSAKFASCLRTYDVKPATFTLGWNYHIKRKNDIVAFSADQGIFLFRIT